MERRGDRHQPFLFAVTVNRHSTTPSGDGGTGSAAFFEVPGRKLYVGGVWRTTSAPDLAPTDELA
jgi:hypothetical protein